MSEREREKAGGTLQRFIRGGSSLRSNGDVRERERERSPGVLYRGLYVEAPP